MKKHHWILIGIAAVFIFGVLQIKTAITNIAGLAWLVFSFWLGLWLPGLVVGLYMLNYGLGFLPTSLNFLYNWIPGYSSNGNGVTNMSATTGGQ